MKVIGVGGTFDRPADLTLSARYFSLHDAAAILLQDGEIVAAAEEERFNRIKHTNKFPSLALRYCLNQASVHPRDIDLWVRSDLPVGLEPQLQAHYLDDPRLRIPPLATDHFISAFEREFGFVVPKDKICFVPHHLGHAASAFEVSPFESALVVTFDGGGDVDSGRIYSVENGVYSLLRSLPDALGQFYFAGTQLVGYRLFDEYKVMGLAPYGDPSRFRHLIQKMFELKPDGEFVLNLDARFEIAKEFQPRRKGDPFSQQYKDLAAALQFCLEEICMHVISYFKTETGHKNLCLAGGVAQNCTFNGRLVDSKLFENVFVQPASHDAGADMGAALWAYREHSGKRPQRQSHLYWGPNIESGEELLRKLGAWSEVISFRKLSNTAAETAKILAEDKVIGWVQGRSEFGPRALGNRSILADPRPARNKGRINEMIKKREAYRPFAPSVQKEHVAFYFEVDPQSDAFEYMVINALVRKEMRERLGAVTHIDGTARVQTVSRVNNPPYWSLIEEFRKLTGVPILLNTSFNNNAEPIVQTADEAIVCYLTTGLDFLVIGDYLVTRRQEGPFILPRMILQVPERYRLQIQPSGGGSGAEYSLAPNFLNGDPIMVTKAVFELLQRSDGRLTVEELLNNLSLDSVKEELWLLWQQRCIDLFYR